MRLRWIWPVWVLATGLSFPAASQQVQVKEAELISLPGISDSNSPVHIRNGEIFVFNSDGMPVRSQGPSLSELKRVKAPHFHSYEHQPLWIEATYLDDDGTLWAWYHHEPNGVCPDGQPLSAPQIGALRSDNNGNTFHDLGIVLSSGDPVDCTAQNGYFAGGNGDFTVLLDREKKYFYFFFSHYAGGPASQGVALARMAYEDRVEPEGKVFRYFQGEWTEPGIGGQTDAIFPVRGDWRSSAPDAFWGPAVHYNRHLKKFVMLLNHSCCTPGWPQEGIYVSYGTDLADPQTWSTPLRLEIDSPGWYPMVIGQQPGDTDKEAGQVVRLFQGSDSWWELTFHP